MKLIKLMMIQNKMSRSFQTVNFKKFMKKTKKIENLDRKKWQDPYGQQEKRNNKKMMKMKVKKMRIMKNKTLIKNKNKQKLMIWNKNSKRNNLKPRIQKMPKQMKMLNKKQWFRMKQ